MLQTLKFIFPHWKTHKWRMLAIVALGLISAAVNTAGPLILKNMIDGLKTGISEHYLKMNVLFLLGLGIALYLVTFLAHRNRGRMNMTIEMEVRERMFGHILGMDRSFFLHFMSGDLVTRLLDDIQEKLSWFACSGVFRAVQAALTFSTVAGVMLWQKVELTLWTLFPVPFLLFLYINIGHKMEMRFSTVQISISRIFSFLEACLTGVRIVKANRKETSQLAAFDKMVMNQRHSEIDAVKLYAVFFSLFQYVGYICIAFVFMAGGKMVIEGRLTLGQLVAFQIYASMIVGPIMDMSNFMVSGTRAGVSVKRLDELLKVRAG